ncbi:DUF1580 domain-containing protein [Tautonia rosea]|uniref:DUF1580 domain-containing protein n=1 Tax=Tautonia rosea TaxID=2728037 RepID=UPI0014752A0B|nr:DUF1580 domain-containing protein [Tautonia rosea]
MIELSLETLIPIGQVPDLIPSSRAGKRVHVSTIWRWVLAGVRGVQLETVTIGGSRYTSREAVQRFVERLSEARERGLGGSQGDPTPTARNRRTEAQRLRDSERAARELEKAGA